MKDVVTSFAVPPETSLPRFASTRRVGGGGAESHGDRSVATKSPYGYWDSRFQALEREDALSSRRGRPRHCLNTRGRLEGYKVFRGQVVSKSFL